MIFNRSRKSNSNVGFAVRTPEDIIRGMKKYPKLMTDELCPNCGTEVAIKAYGKSICPNCGVQILPCSMCEDCQKPCVYWLLDYETKKLKYSENELLKLLDCDWYYVESEPDGHKIIHDMGYAYESVDDGEGEYRIVEYTGLYLEPEILRKRGYDYYDEEQGRNNQYIGDCRKMEVLEYLDGIARCPELPMDQVNESTPEGSYRAWPTDLRRSN